MTERNTPPARRRLAAADRRAKLLEAALHEFSRQGYHPTQMEDVAKAAGVSKALVYRHFPTKEALYAAVTDQVTEAYLSALQALIGSGSDALTSWRTAVTMLVQQVGEAPQAWLLVDRLMSEGAVAEPGSFRDRLYDTVSTLLFQHVPPPADGEPVSATDQHGLTEEDRRRRIRLTVPQLIGGLQGLLRWWLDNRDVPATEITTNAVELAWLGLDRVRAGERLRPGERLESN